MAPSSARDRSASCASASMAPAMQSYKSLALVGEATVGYLEARLGESG